MNNPVAGASPSRALASYVIATRQEDWDTRKALTDFGPQNVQATHDQLLLDLRPLRDVDPQLNGEPSHSVVNHLRVIGMKVRPEMNAEQAGDWCRALLLAFSDLPTSCTVKAAADCVHVPFKFPNEVEAAIRERAELKLIRLQTAQRRLAAMLAALHRAKNPQPRLDDQADRGEPLPDHLVKELQKGPLGNQILRLGLSLGYVKAEQLNTDGGTDQ